MRETIVEQKVDGEKKDDQLKKMTRMYFNTCQGLDKLEEM